jgi:predicted nucleotidyltransferase
MTEAISLPTAYQLDVDRAVALLKAAGCAQVYLFGSLVSGHAREGSDIDLAVRGCPKGSFFQLVGRLMLELGHPVDLVNLDERDAFARYLEQEGEIVQVG